MLTIASKTTTLITRVLAVVVTALLFTPTAARAQTEEVVYYHTDAIGSVRAITDETGAVIERYDFLPFGEALPSTVPETRQFAGKERDAETGLDYFGARHHMSNTGRFTTVDPVMNVESALVDPQQWNRYAYARTNPFRYVDPDGRAIETLWDVFNVALGVSSFINNIHQGAYGSATLDAVGVAIDAAAAAVPLVPGGASSAIRAVRGLDNSGDIVSSGRRLLPFGDSHRISEVNRTLDRIESGKPLAHTRDSTVFRNREGTLPGRSDPDYYREYTVNTPGAKDRGTRRIVRGKGGETYYTDDHYKNFVQIDPKKYF